MSLASVAFYIGVAKDQLSAPQRFEVRPAAAALGNAQRSGSGHATEAVAGPQTRRDHVFFFSFRTNAYERSTEMAPNGAESEGMTPTMCLFQLEGVVPSMFQNRKRGRPSSVLV